MKEQVSNTSLVTPMLFPFDPEYFWKTIRQIIREELKSVDKHSHVLCESEAPSKANKPLYKMVDVCALFQVTKPTIYDWIKHGKLKPFKVRSRVYFLYQDVQRLLQSNKQED